MPRPQRDDYAEVFLGDEPFGRIVVDDEDDERSYNFEKSIMLPGAGRSPKLDTETVAKLNVYLKKQLGEKFSVRKRPTKTDSPTCMRATNSSAWCSPTTAASRSRWRSWSRIWSRRPRRSSRA